MSISSQIKDALKADETIHFQSNVTAKSAVLWALPLIFSVVLTPFTAFCVLFYVMSFVELMGTFMVGLSNDPIERDFWSSSDKKFYDSNLFTIMTTNPLFVALQWLKVPRA